MKLEPTDKERIEGLIRASRRILLITHLDPDGDAIGSLLGLGWLLRGQDKDVTPACQDPVPELYAWLPGSADVVRSAVGSYDLAVSLDCSDVSRMGMVLGSDMTPLPLINIDHHITNPRFGDVYWVDPVSVATAQLILHLADDFGWPVSQPAAMCLLTGLVTDTRGFRTTNVDVQAMRSVLRLMEAGAPLAEISRRTLDERPLASIRLWGEAIRRLKLEDGILWTEVSRDMAEQWSAGADGTTGLTNLLAGVSEARVLAVFTERENGRVDVGFRAAPGCDVAQVALRLGGGGHAQASGCTLSGSLTQVQEVVLAEVRRSLAEQCHTEG